jgi:hypothetical protein
MHRNRNFVAAIIAALAVPFSTPSFAQKLPQPSREVFKCSENGRVVYSDTPCLGASKVNVEPTRGLDSMSGAKKTGADVRRERTNENTAEALRPIFNETAQQRATRHHRFKLSASAKQQCAQLDARIPALERAERGAKGSELAALQETLLGERQEYRSLGC